MPHARAASAPTPASGEPPCNYRLLLPYAAPYFAYVGVATFLRALPSGWNYAVRIVAALVLLAWGWRWYVPLRGPRNPWASALWGALVGLVGTVVWVALLAPFVAAAGDPWSLTDAALRLVAAVLLVPVFEELFMRGYVLRVAYQWGDERRAGTPQALDRTLWERSLDTVAPGAWNGYAIGISTVVFALGHHYAEWPAAMAYGLLMAALWVRRQDLLACVVAHGVTNLALGLYVNLTGNWQLW